MNLKTFLSVLLVYRSNFQVLHWMASGKNFFKLHTKADEYTGMISGDIDIVAEMVLRRENSIVNYKEALDIIEEDENNKFLLLGSDTNYETKEFVHYSRKMFKDILKCIESLLSSEYIQEPKNVGIKASLEGMYDKYDLQCNYLLKKLEED